VGNVVGYPSQDEIQRVYILNIRCLSETFVIVMERNHTEVKEPKKGEQEQTRIKQESKEEERARLQ